MNTFLTIWQTLPTWVAIVVAVYTALAYPVTFVILLLVFVGYLRNGNFNLETRIAPVTRILVTGVILILMWLTLAWLIFLPVLNLLLDQNKRRVIILRLS